ncbi:MAG: hypothetical protein ACK5SI_11585 [Planctomycetia bacterium]|jgi:hypothetical protein
MVHRRVSPPASDRDAGGPARRLPPDRFIPPDIPVAARFPHARFTAD